MTDPFKITEPTCISFSGGRTSLEFNYRKAREGRLVGQYGGVGVGVEAKRCGVSV